MPASDLETRPRRSVPHVLDSISGAALGGAKLCSMCHRTRPVADRGHHAGRVGAALGMRKAGEGPRPFAVRCLSPKTDCATPVVSRLLHIVS